MSYTGFVFFLSFLLFVFILGFFAATYVLGTGETKSLVDKSGVNHRDHTSYKLQKYLQGQQQQEKLRTKVNFTDRSVENQLAMEVPLEPSPIEKEEPSIEKEKEVEEPSPIENEKEVKESSTEEPSPIENEKEEKEIKESSTKEPPIEIEYTEIQPSGEPVLKPGFFKGTLPPSLREQRQKVILKRKEMREDLREQRIFAEKEEMQKQHTPTIYEDPKKAICANSRADCAPGVENCFLGAGHLSYPDCLEKANQIQAKIDKFNEGLNIDDRRRKENVKFISWAPPNNYPEMHEPQCLIFSSKADVITGERGWKTHVHNPESFVMTHDPNVYLIEGKCPVIVDH